MKIADGPVSLEQERGWLRWRGQHCGETKVVYVHQLVEIANGAEPEKIFSNGEWNVHHDNEIRYDNCPANLELLHAEDHVKSQPGEMGPGGKNWDELPVVSIR
jgi:hypothetical protein